MVTILAELHEKWKLLLTKKDLTGDAALKAVEKYGNALRYVEESILTQCGGHR